jgi:muconate cycloisomerase
MVAAGLLFVPFAEPIMPDTILPVPADLRHDLTISEIKSTIVDVPTVRKHKLSSLSVTAQSYVIVELRLANGVIGIGEAATLGGPRWSEESVESIKATIDTYLAPALVGSAAERFEAARARMDEAAKRNNAAKGAIESALFDAVGKTLGVPAVQLLGGVMRDSVPVLWTLASGDPAQEIDEAERKIAARLHNTFKVKIGAQTPEADIARLRQLAGALEGRATLIVDANQAWDETTALRCLPVLAEIGVTLVEQPLPGWNIPGMARLRTRSTVPLMADECVFSTHDMLDVARAGAADVVSLKLVKHGGLLATRDVAAVARAAGIGLYGGCLLESSIGAAAHLQVFAGLRDLAWGCEHFGPQILTGDLVTDPLRFADFHIHLPTGPGLGVTLDPDQLRRYARQ